MDQRLSSLSPVSGHPSPFPRAIRLQFGFVSDPRWQEIERVFLEVVDLEPVARAAYLDQAVATTPNSATPWKASSAQTRAADDPLARAVFASAASDLAEHIATSRVGERVGAYRPRRHHRPWRDGTVYLAERATTRIARRSPSSRARRSRCPGPRAPVPGRATDTGRPQSSRHSATAGRGHTVNGTPYLVLEYIEGVPIDTWCNANSSACVNGSSCSSRCAMPCNTRTTQGGPSRPQAIEHPRSADGTPKLVDFGIAKCSLIRVASRPRRRFAY